MSINDIVNVDMLRNPYNWAVVILMLAISLYALTLLAAPLGQIQTATMQVI